MKSQNFTLKIFITVIFLMTMYSVKAQVAPFETCKTSLNLIVDDDPNLGSGDETDIGSLNSTYAWSTDNGVLTPNGNKSTIDLSGLVVGTIVNIKVIETNVTGCSETPQTFQIKVIAGPSAPTITAPAVCEGEDAIFTIEGTSGNVITYTLDGTTRTGTIQTDGKLIVTKSGVTTDQTLTIVSVASDGTPEACNTTLTGVSATAKVNAKPKTSPIKPI
ncbi:hypothetical protein ACTS9C_04740 [Empedobacter brevis]